MVCSFEEQTMALEEWNHRAHLVVCTWYVMHEPVHANTRMRDGIRGLNRCLGIISTKTSGYHETLTLFWLAKVEALVDVCSGDKLAVLNAVVEGLADSRLVFFHYSRELIASVQARSTWVEPDLVRLPAKDDTRCETPRRFAI